jgi:hypothetical protein
VAAQRRPEVVTVALFGIAGVQSRPDGEAADHRELPQHEALLYGSDGLQRLHRIGERRRVSVTGPGEDVAIVRGDGLIEDAVVDRQRVTHGTGMLFPEPGAAFYVGEQEGNQAARLLYHYHSVPLVCQSYCVTMAAEVR